MDTRKPAVRFAGITKRFVGITALSNVSFDVTAGSCHAICGENGAGKSTLGKLLAGIIQPDAGDIELDGVRVQFASPRAAHAAGVAMVHQELAFCNNLTVGENLCLGDLPRRFGFVNGSELRTHAVALLRAVGASIEPNRTMQSLSVAEQQLVQIAAAVGGGARIIVFDEPSSSLGETEARSLYGLIASLKAQGVTILYVSHRMPEIFRLCDSITVLRDGQHIMTCATGDTDEAALVQCMIGRKLEQQYPVHFNRERGAEQLRVENFASSGHFSGVTFALHAGVVVGLAGLVGAGRSEIAQALFGLDSRATGNVFVRGNPVKIRSAREAMHHGIGFVPEDRKQQGLVLGMRARENATLPILTRYAKLGIINDGQETAAARREFSRLQMRAAPDVVTSTLSGGNQQKIVLAKWLAANGNILILDEPTRGVDVGTKSELHALIGQRAAEGAAILVISSELPELLNVSSRIIVLRSGKICGEVSQKHATQEGLLRMMAGL
ncbi:MAG: sugar ABC transporter ATP-binding protein [Gemmatimonadota bacterium]|nr:sugar ABC transporter ATP-binding protein [Gemmatimonadota bacterium]